jgi:hypothetical protein
MRHILKPLFDLQKKGIRWKLPHKGKWIDCVLRSPFHCLIGDNLGLDKICGHFTSRINVEGVCRKCTVALEATGDPFCESELHKQSEIKDLIERKDSRGLKRKSHYMLTHGNAYDEAEFAAGKEQGVNGSSPADIMHSLKKGTMPRYKECQFGCLRQDKHGREAVLEADLETGTVCAQQLAERKVYTPSMIRMVEHIFLYHGRLLSHQSERIFRSFPPKDLPATRK